MEEEQTSIGNRPAISTKRRRWPAALFLSPFLWGGLLSTGFYALIPFLPVQRELAVRYFCSHPLEYVTATLFFVSMAILVLKTVGLLNERAAFECDLLDDFQPVEPLQPSERVCLTEKKLQALPSRWKNTYLARRIRDVCAYVASRRSSQDLEEHLKYLAELAAERLHESYALVRTITWAVPILGFLGTVVGITIAIANVTPEQLDTSLGDVTNGLAVAFDTTALALTLSLVMVFASFLVERSEQRILTRVEEFGIERISCLFPPEERPRGPLAAAEEQAAQQLIQQTELLVNRQTQLWHESLEAIRRRWTETLDTQKCEFDQALQTGMSATLADHAKQLSALRAEFLGAFQRAAQELTGGLAESRQAQQQQQQQFEHQLNELWRLIQTDMVAFRADEKTRIEELAQTISQNVSSWQTQLHESTQTGTAQLGELRKQSETLLNVVAQEEQLTRLQERLSQNLESVRAAETFEETLHSLSAAVHLLTARAKPKAA